MITTNSKVAALASAVALVGMVLLAPAAHAQTMSTTTTTTTSGGTTMTSTMSAAAMQQEIASLQAQLAASQGTSMMTGSSALFTMDLTTGSTGSQVTALQSWLISKGYSIPAGATGYFGSQTTAALAAYQAANGISPAVGYFGPITRAHVNAAGGSMTTTTTSTVAGCAAGAMYSSTTGQACGTMTTTGGTTTGGSTTLSGSEGSVNNFQTIGASNVTLGTGASQQVYGFQFQAGGSDLNVSRIYFDISNSGSTGTTRPWNVFSTATLTNGSGQTIATLDGSNQNNYSEDGTIPQGSAGAGNQIYRLDFENVNQVVKMNDTQSYYLTLSTQGAFATGNAGGVYNVGLASQGLRATDAMGLQEYSPNLAGTSVVTINNNATGSVTLSTGSDNPQTTTLMANQNTATNNVVLNTFTLDNTGGSSVELYTLPVLVTVAGTTTYPGEASALIENLSLYQGSTLLDTESPSSTFGNSGTISFKNLNVVIPAGTTDTFSVEANIQPVGYQNPAPTNSSVVITVPGNGLVDLEASGGAIITPNGTSTGYPISFAINGLSAASSPSSASATATLASGQATQQTGTFTFVFNVTAFGQTIYVSSTSQAFNLSVMDQTAGGATTTGVTSALTTSANRSPDGNFQINSGQTATVTVTATKSGGGSSHYFYATLSSLNYGTSDATPTGQTVTLPSNYTTNAVSIAS
jgi:peptidoglycan hydrolase-like protein with peptidoglycan-binding domain